MDTSVLIASERRGYGLTRIEEGYISAMTVAEIALGVTMAGDADEYALRRHTAVRVEDSFTVLDIDEETAKVYGRIMGSARRAGRRPSTADTLIAATAIVEDLPLVTQDADFLAFEEHGLDVILV